MTETSPYRPPNPELRGDNRARGFSPVQVFHAVIAMLLLGLCLLFTTVEAYFTLHPAKLQSGGQTSPANFSQSDMPVLVFWCSASFGLAALLVLITMRTISGVCCSRSPQSQKSIP